MPSDLACSVDSVDTRDKVAAEIFLRLSAAEAARLPAIAGDLRGVAQVIWSTNSSEQAITVAARNGLMLFSGAEYVNTAASPADQRSADFAA